jgi:CYTH domain-containing protein
MPGKGDNNQEIEARFLACGNSWRDKGSAVEIYQGYLSTSEDMALRIRIEGGRAILTIKGKAQGITRKEYEFELDDPDGAKTVIDTFCAHPIQKTRHIVDHGEFTWEVDEYKGENQGLVVAEVEFEQEEDYTRMLAQGKPDWAGADISTDAWQYTNARLAVRPFSAWSAEKKKDMVEHAAGRALQCARIKNKARM